MSGVALWSMTSRLVGRGLVGNATLLSPRHRWNLPAVCTLSSTTKKILINEEITAPKVRLVYVDPDTEKKQHQIISIKEAIRFAKNRGLDVVAVNMDADPPVCKLENYGKVAHEMKKRDAAIRAQRRTTLVKEILVTLGIDPHDFGTKMKRCKKFLENGNTVKLYVSPRRKKRVRWVPGKYRSKEVPVVSKSPLDDIDQTTHMILTELEELSVNVQQKDIYKEYPIGGTTGKRGKQMPVPKQVAQPTGDDQVDEETEDGDVESEGSSSSMDEAMEDDMADDDDYDDDDKSVDSDDSDEDIEDLVKSGDKRVVATPTTVKVFSKREFTLTAKSRGGATKKKVEVGKQ